MFPYNMLWSQPSLRAQFLSLGNFLRAAIQAWASPIRLVFLASIWSIRFRGGTLSWLIPTTRNPSVIKEKADARLRTGHIKFSNLAWFYFYISSLAHVDGIRHVGCSWRCSLVCACFWFILIEYLFCILRLWHFIIWIKYLWRRILLSYHLRLACST